MTGEERYKLHFPDDNKDLSSEVAEKSECDLASVDDVILEVLGVCDAWRFAETFYNRARDAQRLASSLLDDRDNDRRAAKKERSKALDLESATERHGEWAQQLRIAADKRRDKATDLEKSAASKHDMAVEWHETAGKRRARAHAELPKPGYKDKLRRKIRDVNPNRDPRIFLQIVRAFEQHIFQHEKIGYTFDDFEKTNLTCVVSLCQHWAELAHDQIYGGYYARGYET